MACGVEKKHGEDVCLVALPAAWEGNARVECAWRGVEEESEDKVFVCAHEQ